MAEIKKKKIISASTGEEVTGKKKIKEAAPTGSSVGYRIGAIVLWVLAFAFEVLAILVALGKFSFHFMPSLWQLIIFLVLDLICVVIGSLLWKKANHISPASEKNKVKFWLWNNLGVIVSVAAFVPFIIIMLSSKNNDKRTKAIATVVAIVALLIAGVCSYDFNPVSQEKKDEAVSTLGDGTVYWSPFGHVYHTHDDCSHLNHSDTLTSGTVEQAIAANRTRLCKSCAARDNITNLETDDATVDTEFEKAESEIEKTLS
ncbi:MAG: hypothetical protein IJK33_03140 [Clostridia bacterium]|nr:hypothetical protein [Clostridia bacterium]